MSTYSRFVYLAAVALPLCGVTSLHAQTTPPSGQTSTQTPGTVPPNPGASVPVAPDFVIGPEDVIGVLFWREADVSGDVTVRPDGRITLQLIGEIQAAGLRPEELRNELFKAGGKYLKDLQESNVTVVMRQINSRKVFITGEVTMEGAFPLTGPRTVMQLIALAGGLTDFADAKDISILRGNKVFKFNYEEVKRGRRPEQNILLQPGDTVVVP